MVGHSLCHFNFRQRCHTILSSSQSQHIYLSLTLAQVLTGEGITAIARDAVWPMEGFDQQRFELLKVGHGADSKTLLYENITGALTDLEPD